MTSTSSSDTSQTHDFNVRIQKYLSQCDNTLGAENKYKVSCEMFDYLLTNKWFLTCPDYNRITKCGETFCNMVYIKLSEFVNGINSEDLPELKRNKFALYLTQLYSSRVTEEITDKAEMYIKSIGNDVPVDMETD